MKITTIRIPDQLYQRASVYIKEKEMKLSGLVRLGIKRIIEENGTKSDLQ